MHAMTGFVKRLKAVTTVGEPSTQIGSIRESFNESDQPDSELIEVQVRCQFWDLLR